MAQSKEKEQPQSAPAKSRYVCLINFKDGQKTAEGTKLSFKRGDIYVGTDKEIMKQSLDAGLIMPEGDYEKQLLAEAKKA